MNLRKTALYIFIGFIVSGIIFGALFFFLSNRSKSEIAVSYKTYEYDLGEFSTNLGNTRNYFKGTIILETLDRELLKKLDKKDAEIRDNIIATLIGKKADEILQPDGQSELKNEILKVVADIVNSDKITNIYFIDYIIQ